MIFGTIDKITQLYFVYHHDSTKISKGQILENQDDKPHRVLERHQDDQFMTNMITVMNEFMIRWIHDNNTNRSSYTSVEKLGMKSRQSTQNHGASSGCLIHGK